jgi:DNA-binding transcriptional ArsR family regulator
MKILRMMMRKNNKISKKIAKLSSPTKYEILKVSLKK